MKSTRCLIGKLSLKEVAEMLLSCTAALRANVQGGSYKDVQRTSDEGLTGESQVVMKQASPRDFTFNRLGSKVTCFLQDISFMIMSGLFTKIESSESQETTTSDPIR